MPIGPAVRARLGRFERPVAEAYRSWFIDLDEVVTTLASITTPRSILEIGCGAGDLTARLVEAFRAARVVGIDIADGVGSRCPTESGRVTFHQSEALDLVPEHAGSFDVVVLCDVLHHVPTAEREALVRTAAALCAPGGVLLLKDWEPARNLANLAATISDRYLTGDRHVLFLPRAELHALATKGAPGFRVAVETRVPPRRNNLLLALTAPP